MPNHHCTEGCEKSKLTHPSKVWSLTTYPIYDVDKGLGITPLEVVNRIGRAPV